MNCSHPRVVVVPESLEKSGDGVIISGLETGTMHCQNCQEPLPIEDLQLYDKEHISVGIPTELVDDPAPTNLTTNS